MKISKYYWPTLCLIALTALFLGTRSLGKIPDRPVRFEQFPLSINQWHGQDIPMEARIVSMLGVEDYLNRAYLSVNQEIVYLYIGYYQTQKQGETMHSPKNCLPGSGWEPFDVGHEKITLESGRAIEINRYHIEKGNNHQAVYYWYQSHNRTIASEYKAKIYMVWDAMVLNRTDGALVRVICPVSISLTAAENNCKDFIKALYPHLDRFIPQ
jgi:EpsI family protein